MRNSDKELQVRLVRHLISNHGRYRDYACKVALFKCGCPEPHLDSVHVIDQPQQTCQMPGDGKAKGISMNRIDIDLPDKPNHGGSAHTKVDSHGVSVSFGDFTWFSIDELGVHFNGGEELEKRLAPLVAKVRELVKPAPIFSPDMHDEEMKSRNSIPKSAVAPLVKVGTELMLEHFQKHPAEFKRWLKERDAEKVRDGRVIQARLFREAMMVAQDPDSQVGARPEELA